MSTLSNVLSKSAPILSNILNLALPGSGLVLNGLMSLFGVRSNSEDDLANTIANDPAAAEKLKEFEIAHRYDLEQIQAADRQSARTMAIETAKATGKRDWVADFIAITIVIGFLGMCLIVAFTKMDSTDHDIFYMLLGVFGSGFSCILNYFFGSSVQTKFDPNKSKSQSDVLLPPPAQTR